MPVILLAGAATLTLVLLWLALAAPSGGKATGRRLEAVRARHALSPEASAQSQLRRLTHRGDTGLDDLMSRLLPRPDALRRRLDQTGRDWTLGGYGVASAGIAIALAILLRVQGANLLLALTVGLAAGIVLPHKAVTVLIERRLARFTARFPEAIELLVRGLRSGLPISETLGVVGSEVPDPVGEEFRAVADRIRIGRTMDAALQETADRLDTPEFHFFCITLAIQRETGGNLAETLSNLSDVLRKRSQMKLKIKAMSSESRASALIIGAMPFIVFTLIWFINASYMQAFFTEPRLMIAGGVGLAWMAIGGVIMGKMVNFEI